jgi:hypothetical protein
MSVTIADPCWYCGRRLVSIAAQGCGSQEFSQREVDRFCRVLAWAKRNVRSKR